MAEDLAPGADDPMAQSYKGEKPLVEHQIEWPWDASNPNDRTSRQTDDKIAEDLAILLSTADKDKNLPGEGYSQERRERALHTLEMYGKLNAEAKALVDSKIESLKR